MTKSTFSSIVDQTTEPQGVWSTCKEVKEIFPSLQKRYLPDVASIPVYQGLSWVPTWKSVPSLNPQAGRRSSIFVTLGTEVLAATQLLSAAAYRYETGIPMFSLCLPRVCFALDPENDGWVNRGYDWFLSTYHFIFSEMMTDPDALDIVPQARLASVVEGGGKRRLFIIGNDVRQRLLKPFHDWAMKVLRSIPQDGTYEQDKPLKSLRGSRDVYSFDLKSATDRWPIGFIVETMRGFFGDQLTESLVEAALGLGIFTTGSVTKKPQTLEFLCGQPLGYYASWPLFSLSHHFAIWMAADRVYPGVRFKAYAVLGDDVVIADSRVAEEYSCMVARMGVKISLPKSLVSHTGALEFAKRFWVKSVGKDLSPVSMRALLGCRTVFGLCEIKDAYHIKQSLYILCILESHWQTLMFRSSERSPGPNLYVRRGVDNRRFGLIPCLCLFCRLSSLIDLVPPDGSFEL